MNNRKAINIDLNPLAVFMLDALIASVDIKELSGAFQKIKSNYERLEPKTKEDIESALMRYEHPKGFILPQTADVEKVENLFNDVQLAKLSLLKNLINKVKDKNIKKTLLLMFSGLITKFNLTYHPSSSRGDGGGDAAAFRYYRYRLAPNPADIDLMKYFEIRFKKIVSAKKEIQYYINEKTINNLINVKGTATDLRWIDNESVDYIYTDPPYGKKIQYLDLSIMWNAWLDLEVTEEDYQLEAIEGGEHNKTKDNYNSLIAKSIEEMYRVLKFDRWMSFVFAHKDPEFWHLIIDTAERCGFEYVGAVSQKNGQTSFKKRQNPFTVLSGQLIINFKKVRNPRAIMKANLGMNISEIIIQTIEGIIAKYDGATLEQINDELIIKGLELGFLDLLKKEYSDITPFLLANFDFDQKTEIYTLKPLTKFKTNIDIRLRIKYYLISYLRRKQNEGHYPLFDDIVLDIMPLLKNGITPEHQTILNVLEDIAEHIGSNQWKLKEEGQINIFGKIY